MVFYQSVTQIPSTAYAPLSRSGTPIRTTFGQPMKGGVSRGTAHGQKGMPGARNLYERLIKNHLVFTPEARIQGK